MLKKIKNSINIKILNSELFKQNSKKNIEFKIILKYFRITKKTNIKY